MRDQPGENKWADVDVSYTSALWEERGVVASEVFIVPTVVSGKGTRHLLSITDQGISDLGAQATDLADEAKTVDHEQTAIKFALLQEHRFKQQLERRGLTELSARIRAFRVLQDFEAYAALVDQAHQLAEHLLGKFGQLQKVAQRVLAEQEEKGDELTRTPEAVKKLTISMKCVDTIWADIISSWTKLKTLRNEVQEAKVALPPIRRSVRVVRKDDDGVEDGDGEGEGDGNGEAAQEDAQ
ncbi:uncharacterized protein Z520_08657 [Fonsecaea multimorphosa CBS 102226]|uniref:Uncharacterized protein n=1 Tax=Fonsecaea multimorphosa CBS 102226 TaxID=1442371 RepID=A0A0D2JQA9_9EURO|nr:uncharacterized protein Z520_08657 [Fonsecaea multimorphosa CBS 102226]KIX95537.1 hypothetical protein Z520_08657 [Fonsecaea multimorphosa CBS 102226]OAL21383.1 hypothetical protein AYO22_08106 [Fonsecaea multimorphosa]